MASSSLGTGGSSGIDWFITANAIETCAKPEQALHDLTQGALDKSCFFGVHAAAALPDPAASCVDGFGFVGQWFASG